MPVSDGSKKSLSLSSSSEYSAFYDELQQTFFLSAMQEITNGRFCAERGAGCAMVQLGIWFAEPTATKKEKGQYTRSFLPDDPNAYFDYFAKEIQDAKQRAQPYTCLTVAALELEWALTAAQRFFEAGGDFVELNVHGGYWRYLEQGKMQAMVLADHQTELLEWVEGFAALPIPLILKLHGKFKRRQLLQTLDKLTAYPLFAVHMDIRDSKTKKPDLKFVQSMKTTYPWFLLTSGYIRAGSDVQELFAAGVDMIGIAEPTLEDAQYIAKTAAEYAAMSQR